MRNIDETYKAELNFVDEFNLSRNGMIKEGFSTLFMENLLSYICNIVNV